MSPTRTPVRGTLFGVLLCTLSLAACEPAPASGPSGDAPSTGAGAQPVVYGTDNRTDVYAHADATLRTRAQQSTVALMNPSDYTVNATTGVVTFNAPTLRSLLNLCSSERFLNDLTPAFCSGTLIDEDLVLTAGHCITSASVCTNTRFVFNFYRTDATTMQQVTSQDIFSCKSIVVRQQATTSGRNLDYAIVKLDRPATPRFTPAPVRTATTPMAVGANVTVIGSGSGIPFKIDSGGSVRDARAGTLDYFVANTDTFGGNSGSGVYEMGGYTVAGILVRGDTDYRANGSCTVVNVCTETGCGGEDITYVRPALDAFCAVATSARLCSSEPPPPPPPATRFTYTASNTSNATTRTTNQTVALTAGQKITLGTCGLAGASVTGDTYLRLFGPAATEVGSNDDACAGRGSQLRFTATLAGTYEIRAGCYGGGSCGGTVVWALEAPPPPVVGGVFDFSASNTQSAQQNTRTHDVTLAAGQTLSFGTCPTSGGSGTGDTFLRLYNAAGQQVGSNDDACGSLSHVTYTVPAGAGGTYQIRAGCYGSGSCAGVVAWTLQ